MFANNLANDYKIFMLQLIHMYQEKHIVPENFFKMFI